MQIQAIFQTLFPPFVGIGTELVGQSHGVWLLLWMHKTTMLWRQEIFSMGLMKHALLHHECNSQITGFSNTGRESLGLQATGQRPLLIGGLAHLCRPGQLCSVCFRKNIQEACGYVCSVQSLEVRSTTAMQDIPSIFKKIVIHIAHLLLVGDSPPFVYANPPLRAECLVLYNCFHITEIFELAEHSLTGRVLIPSQQVA